MADQRNGGIAWTDETWNPLRGCSRVSEGCVNCYAETVAHRFGGPGQPYEGLTNEHGRWNGKVAVVEKLLEKPLRWTKPRRVFVNSMSDLFHEAVSDEAIERIVAIMALAPQHTFQVLTKRPERMLEWFAKVAGLESRAEGVAGAAEHRGIVWDARGSDRNNYLTCAGGPPSKENLAKRRPWPGWPLPNVWLGVSVEDQKAADERIPLLLQTPAAVRFLSCEPLLGPVDLSPWIGTYDCRACGYVGFEIGEESYCYQCEEKYEDTPEDEGCPKCGTSADSLVCPKCGATEHEMPSFGMTDYLLGTHNNPMLHWVIVGGESGPNARPMHPDWARTIRDQCQAAGVAFFFKQWGEWGPAPWKVEIDADPDDTLLERKAEAEKTGATHAYAVWAHKHGHIPHKATHRPWSMERTFLGDDHAPIRRWGKYAAGRELDGRTWDEFPEGAHA